MAQSLIESCINSVYPDSADALKSEMPAYLRVAKAFPKVGDDVLSHWKSRDVALLLDTLFPQYASAEEVSQIEQALTDQEFLDRDNLDDDTAMAEMELPEIENLLGEAEAPAFDKQKFLLCMRYILGMLCEESQNG